MPHKILTGNSSMNFQEEKTFALKYRIDFTEMDDDFSSLYFHQHKCKIFQNFAKEIIQPPSRIRYWRIFDIGEDQIQINSSLLRKLGDELCSHTLDDEDKKLLNFKKTIYHAYKLILIFPNMNFTLDSSDMDQASNYFACVRQDKFNTDHTESTIVNQFHSLEPEHIPIQTDYLMEALDKMDEKLHKRFRKKTLGQTPEILDLVFQFAFTSFNRYQILDSMERGRSYIFEYIFLIPIVILFHFLYNLELPITGPTIHETCRETGIRLKKDTHFLSKISEIGFIVDTMLEFDGKIVNFFLEFMDPRFFETDDLTKRSGFNTLFEKLMAFHIGTNGKVSMATDYRSTMLFKLNKDIIESEDDFEVRLNKELGSKFTLKDLKKSTTLKIPVETTMIKNFPLDDETLNDISLSNGIEQIRALICLTVFNTVITQDWNDLKPKNMETFFNKIKFTESEKRQSEIRQLLSKTHLKGSINQGISIIKVPLSNITGVQTIPFDHDSKEELDIETIRFSATQPASINLDTTKFSDSESLIYNLFDLKDFSTTYLKGYVVYKEIEVSHDIFMSITYEAFDSEVDVNRKINHFNMMNASRGSFINCQNRMIGCGVFYKFDKFQALYISYPKPESLGKTVRITTMEQLQLAIAQLYHLMDADVYLGDTSLKNFGVLEDGSVTILSLKDSKSLDETFGPEYVQLCLERDINNLEKELSEKKFKGYIQQ